MVEKCQGCGKALIKFPIKGQQNKSLLDNINEGTINWNNLWKVDWKQLATVVIILILAWSYTDTVNNHREVIENLCEFNTRDNCCELKICPEVIENNCCIYGIGKEQTPEKFEYVKDLR